MALKIFEIDEYIYPGDPEYLSPCGDLNPCGARSPVIWHELSSSFQGPLCCTRIPGHGGKHCVNCIEIQSHPVLATWEREDVVRVHYNTEQPKPDWMMRQPGVVFWPVNPTCRWCGQHMWTRACLDYKAKEVYYQISHSNMDEVQLERDDLTADCFCPFNGKVFDLRETQPGIFNMEEHQW